MTEQSQAPPPGWWLVLSAQLNLIDGRLGLIEQEIHQLKEMATMAQSDIDALTTQVADLQTALAGDVTSINAEIAALEQQVANDQPVDLTALQAAVSSLSSTVDSANTIVPTPPAV